MSLIDGFLLFIQKYLKEYANAMVKISLIQYIVIFVRADCDAVFILILMWNKENVVLQQLTLKKKLTP